MRSIAKQAVERALVASGALALGRRRVAGDVLVLAYHNIVADGQGQAGDASLHLRRSAFAAQLDVLAATHDVVSLADALDGRAGRGRPRVVITFDDAYHGALEHGLPELVARGMASTVFAAPGLLGGFTWWDTMADPAIGAVPAGLRDELLTQLEGDGTRILARYPRPAPPASLRIATEDELLHAATLPGVSIGSHTWSHSNLASLTPSAIEAELRRSKSWLEARVPRFVPWVTYPYGLFEPSAERAAADCGYTGALRVDGGWIRQGPDRARYALPRLNVPSSLTIDGFRLRVNGLYGA